MPLNKTALIANIEADVADNITGDISAQDIRDNVLDMVDTIFDIPGDGTRGYSQTITQGSSTSGALSVIGNVAVTGDLTVNGSSPVFSNITISTTTPLTGGGDLSTNRVLGITQATNLVDGFLSSGDWTTFNNKLSSTAPGSTTELIMNSGGSYAATSGLKYVSNTLIPTTNDTLYLGTSTNQFSSLNCKETNAYGNSSNTYVRTFCSSGIHPSMDFVVGGGRKLVFGYDVNALRATLYSDVLGQGYHFYEGSGLAIGTDVSTYAGNQVLINGASTSNTVIIKTSQAAAKVLTVRGAASQTGNLLELQNSASTLVSAFDSGGRLGVLGSPYNTGVAISAYKSGGIGLYTNGEIWALDGTNQRFLFGTNTATYSSYSWDNATSKLHITGNGNLSGAITLPFVSGQVSLVGINQASPTATLDVTCNGSNTIKVMRVQSTQVANDAVIEDTIQLKIATTDATQTHTTIQATATNYTYIIETVVIARRTGGASGAAGDSASYKISSQFNNIAGVLTQASSGTLQTVIHEAQTGWDADFSVTGTSIRLSVTGAASNNITWHATSKIYILSS